MPTSRNLKVKEWECAISMIKLFKIVAQIHNTWYQALPLFDLSKDYTKGYWSHVPFKKKPFEKNVFSTKMTYHKNIKFNSLIALFILPWIGNGWNSENNEFYISNNPNVFENSNSLELDRMNKQW